MNTVMLIGRLTKDIEIRSTQTGKPVAAFSLAVDRRGKDAGADFINCVAWNQTAEAMNRYLHKGSKIAVVGRLQTRTYDGREGKRYVTEVIVNEVDFLDTRSDSKPAEKQTAPASLASDDEFVELGADDGVLPWEN